MMMASVAFKLGKHLMQMRYQAFLNYAHFQKPLRFEENTKIRKIMNIKFFITFSFNKSILNKI